MTHQDWRIGDWHINVDLVNGRWSWQVNDLACALDPIVLGGDDLPDMKTAVRQAFDLVADLDAVYFKAKLLRQSHEALRRSELVIPATARLEPGATTFDDDAPLKWLGLS